LYSFIHVYLCYLHRSLLAARLLLRFRSYGYAAPRDLRSFPTRRSSDLGAGGPVRPRTWISAAGTDGGVSHHQLDGHDDVGPHPRDRKSTRLNSSHVSISYAVFCLKKKTILADTFDYQVILMAL